MPSSPRSPPDPDGNRPTFMSVFASIPASLKKTSVLPLRRALSAVWWIRSPQITGPGTGGQGGLPPKGFGTGKQSASGATTFSSVQGWPAQLSTSPLLEGRASPYTINAATMRLCGADHPAPPHLIPAGEPLPQRTAPWWRPLLEHLLSLPGGKRRYRTPAGTSSTSPQAPTLSPMMITAPSTPSISGATARARLMSPGFFI